MFASWLYVSISRLDPEAATEDVERIVAVSNIRNRALDVTGALLFTGDRFVQLIEGPSNSITELQRSIFRDARHHEVTTIRSDDIEECEFWAGHSPMPGRRGSFRRSWGTGSRNR